jgi:NAD(P)H dehydrogenase (quinone)
VVDSTASSAAEPGTTILVTGGTGRQGGTGRAVVKGLIERGFQVRALVRRIDERADLLTRLGAHVVVGDYTDYRSLVAALDGIESAYFCYPVAAGIAEAAGLFATAGRLQGLRRIVDLSLAATRPDSPSPQARAQWVAEQIFEWSGFGGTHLRVAAFFMENIVLLDGQSVRDHGRIANAFGDYKINWISGGDVGAIAANLLAKPALAVPRTIVVSGAEQLTYEEVARTISNVSGLEVRYEELSPEAWRAEMVAAPSEAGESNVRGADHLVAQAVALRRMPAIAATRDVQRFTGREGLLLASFVALNRDALTPRDT